MVGGIGGAPRRRQSRRSSAADGEVQSSRPRIRCRGRRRRRRRRRGGGGGDWDEEFEESVRGLSEEELVDELIENSPSLAQLEVEIISQEMERSAGREVGGSGDGEGEDDDSLEDFDLSGNPAYVDFRVMVLEDYREGKRRTAGRRAGESTGGDPPTSPAATTTATTTNFATKSDLSAYPPDWKDYDTGAAFRRDFSEGGGGDPRGGGAPPPSGFVPSSSSRGGRSRDDRAEARDGGKGDGEGPGEGGSRRRGLVADVTPPPADDDLDGAIDWLQARRSRLGGDDADGRGGVAASGGVPGRPTRLLTPEQAESFRHRNSQIPVVIHTLLKTSELISSLIAQGGTDVRVIDTSDLESVHGVGIGCDSILLVTGRNPSHIRVMADSIVRNLKARRLHERGVMGAMQGAEGGQDVFTNRRSRNRARRHGAANTSGRIDDDWMVVDCDNIHVHVMEETTRRCLNIESLWDLKDPSEYRTPCDLFVSPVTKTNIDFCTPGFCRVSLFTDSDGRIMRRINLDDDDALDEYITRNPIPDEYAAKIFNDGGGRRSDGWMSGGAGSRVQTVLPVSQRKSFSDKWSGRSEGKGRRSQRAKR